jgi:hypothetical protein
MQIEYGHSGRVSKNRIVVAAAKAADKQALLAVTIVNDTNGCRAAFNVSPRTLASIASWVNDYPADSRVAKDGLRLSATTSITRAEGESILAILDADPAMAEIRRSHAERVYDASDAWRKAKEVSDRNRSFMEGYERGTVRVGGRPPTQQQVEDHRRRTTESEGVTATAFAALEAIRAEVV